MSTQRVYVSTHKVDGKYPWFAVHASVSDAFIGREVEKRFGLQESGEPHEWEAFEEKDCVEDEETAKTF